MKSDAKLQELFKVAPKRFVQFGGQLRVYLGAEVSGKVEQDIKSALSRGVTVREGGAAKWVEHIPLFDASKQGSDRYTWDKSGDRVRCEKILFLKSSSGEVTKMFLGLSWRDAAEVL